MQVAIQCIVKLLHIFNLYFIWNETIAILSMLHNFPLDKCCNDLEINLEDLYTKPSTNFTGGRFRKQAFFSHERVVYHDSELDYYLYFNGKDWVVSVIKFMIILTINQFLNNVIVSLLDQILIFLYFILIDRKYTTTCFCSNG